MIDDVIRRWHSFLLDSTVDLDELLAQECTFFSPIVFTPQEGRDITAMYLQAAKQTLAGGEDGRFHYTKEVLSGDTAVLEFETTLNGKYVNGVDIIRCNDKGLIVEFRVMIRPLQAINAVYEEMRAALEAMD